MVEKVDLIATKAMSYSTRRLVADDLFQASRRDARLLVAIGKAKFADESEQAPAKPKVVQTATKPKAARRKAPTKPTVA